MKNNPKLNKQLRKIILKEAKSNPEMDMLSEGFFNKVVDHIKGILEKSNDKAFVRGVEKLAKSGPHGKKVAKDLLDQIARLEKEFEDIERSYNL